MIHSMTGYGQGFINRDDREIKIELRSLNHRYLDLNIRLPKNLSFLEDVIRSKIQSSVARGRIEVTVTYKNNGKGSKDITVDTVLLKSYIDSIEKIEQATDIKNDIAMSDIIKLPDVLTINEVEEDQKILNEMVSSSLDDALNSLLSMRETEGQKLYNDIIARIDYIEKIVNKIEKSAPCVVTEYRDKLKLRITELLKDTDFDENRFNMEVAYFADRSNITEEIVRLKSHINQLRTTLNLSEPVGKKLDFLIQETNREINTIGAKANYLEITQCVLEAKSEIEKIREQIQNIE